MYQDISLQTLPDLRSDFKKVRHKSHFAQVSIQYTYGQSIRNRNWNTQTQWKKIGREVTASHRDSVITQQYSSTSMRFHSL